MAPQVLIRSPLILLLGMALACQAAPSHPMQDSAPGPSALPKTTEAPPSTPTPTRVPPPLPAPFESRYVNPLDAIHTYEADTCTYLQNKWDPAKAAPGTIVMLVMLHSINQGKPEASDAINQVIFGRMMNDLYAQRFQAINTDQLAGFLERNARIPARSVVLIQDGRRYPENFEKHFQRYWDEWGWPVVNAWDHQGSLTEPLWEDYVTLSHEGWVDFQVYGPTFDPEAKPQSDEYLTDQLQIPMDMLQERLGSAPIAVAWPNGFSAQSVRIARKLGYRLGFTLNGRGPLMYNWIPLSDAVDPLRPSYRPEGTIGDPLMVLPRFWPQQVHTALDAVRITGEGAAAFAGENKGIELEYYDIECSEKYGAMPQ